MDVQRELLIEQRVANEAKSPLIACTPDTPWVFCAVKAVITHIP